MKDHRCTLQTQERFWEPVTEKKWNSHWFYDFETTRGEEVGDNEYKHEVMAWCIKLMIPDDETALYIDNDAVISQLDEAIPLLPFDDIDSEQLGSSYRIWGKDILSFVEVVEKVLTRNTKTFKWNPTLWAHNGSKVRN